MITKNQISFIHSLRDASVRRSEQLFVVEGNKPVEELLNSNLHTVSIYVTESWLEKFTPLTQDFEVVGDKQMQQMSGMVTPPGILAIAKIPQYSIAASQAAEEKIIALDGINDPGNLGTIIRTADWFGIKKVVASSDSADFWQQKTIQSAMGSLFRCEVMRCDLTTFLQEARGKDIPTYGALMQGENIFTKKLTNHGIIIIGSESHGIKPENLNFISCPIHIPHGEGSVTESLNASVAAAIIIAQFERM